MQTDSAMHDILHRKFSINATKISALNDIASQFSIEPSSIRPSEKKEFDMDFESSRSRSAARRHQVTGYESPTKSKIQFKYMQRLGVN